MAKAIILRQCCRLVKGQSLGVTPDLNFGCATNDLFDLGKLRIFSVSSSTKWEQYQFLPHRVIVRNKWVNTYKALKIVHHI